VLARARARDDNYHGLPSTGNLWRSTRATASLLWGKKKRENDAREGRRETRRVREEECTCINFAPWHAAHTRSLAVRVIRSLYRHADFRNTGLCLGPPFLLRRILSRLFHRSRCFLPLHALCNMKSRRIIFTKDKRQIVTKLRVQDVLYALHMQFPALKLIIHE